MRTKASIEKKKKLELRDYQQQAIDDVLSTIKDYKRIKTIVVQPCGAGKSLIIAKLCEVIKKPILVLQPSKELLEQNYGKFRMFGGEAAIFSASVGIKEIDDVTYATPMSVKKMGKEFKKLGVKFVVIDECHHSSKTNGAIAKLLKQINPSHVIGLTATPLNLHTNLESGTTLRMINEYHKSIFNHICHITQTRDIVEKGFWSPVQIEVIQQDQDKLKLNTQGTDFTLDSMLEFYDDNKLSVQILQQFDEGLQKGRKHCLIFTPSIERADDLAKKDKRIKVVSSNTPKTERQQILEDFKSGIIKGVATVDAIATGFDFPELDFIIMARPTASYTIYYQQYGRGVRIHPNKKDLLLVDLVGNTTKFGRPEEMTYEYIEDYGWGMFLGEYLMTKVNLKNGLKVKKEHLLQGVQTSKKSVEVAQDELWFGKHKGKKVSEIPHSYLDWMLSKKDFNWAGEKDKKKIESFKNACLVELGRTPKKDTPVQGWRRQPRTDRELIESFQPEKQEDILW